MDGYQGAKDHLSANRYMAGMEIERATVPTATFCKRARQLCARTRTAGYSITVADRFMPVVLDAQTKLADKNSKHSCAIRCKKFRDSDVCCKFVDTSGELWDRIIKKLIKDLANNQNFIILQCFSGLAPAKTCKMNVGIPLYPESGVDLNPNGTPKIHAAYRIPHISWWNNVSKCINKLLENVKTLLDKVKELFDGSTQAIKRSAAL